MNAEECEAQTVTVILLMRRGKWWAAVVDFFRDLGELLQEWQQNVAPARGAAVSRAPAKRTCEYSSVEVAAYGGGIGNGGGSSSGSSAWKHVRV
jgi:hypothetical protein